MAGDTIIDKTETDEEGGEKDGESEDDLDPQTYVSICVWLAGITEAEGPAQQ